MSKEEDSKHNPPNVVAKLMGIETLPREEPNLSVERSHRKGDSQHMYGHLGPPFQHWQLKDRFMDKEMLHEVHPSREQIAYKDIYEIWLQSQKASHVRDKTPERGRWREDVDRGKMALIHQKFMEAKHLSTDERLRQSKQFEDALEILSSNSDLLIRLLDSNKLYEHHSTTPPAQTKCITLIKPLKMVDNGKSGGKGKKNERLIKKPPNVDQAAIWENKIHGYYPESQKVDEFPVQSTRIVVLKPSFGRTHKLKAVVSPTTSSPLESTEAAKEITQQMHEGLRSYQKGGTLYYGYSGDECSFNKSYHEYTAGNCSDLEAMSPLTRHSWNYTNGCDSTYSTPSLGLASCSPESSVCREAKKRLSERWTMMASYKKGPQEQRHLRRIPTLGEMLSLSHTKKSATSEFEGIDECQEPSKSVSCSHSFNEGTCIDGSPKNLPRSNSVPAYSTVYETGLSIEVCDHNAGKAHDSKVLTKSKSKRSSFKGKVASFLFSRKKKSTKEKSCPTQSKDESQYNFIETSVFPVNSPGVLTDDMSQSINGGGFEECSITALYESSGKTSTDSVSKGHQQGIITPEPGLTVTKPMVPDISSENQEQPSPISVLEPPFEDYNAVHESLDSTMGGHQGSWMPLKSNLIDKSPPIESIARTLSWDDFCADVAASPYPLKPLMVSSLDAKEEEQEWLLLVQKLLSEAGLDDQELCNSFYTRWHSLESPLDPSLRDTYANLSDKESQPLHDARRRKMRSNQKLVFDHVNAALLEIIGYGSESYYFKGRMYSGSHSKLPVQEGASPLLLDHIVAQMKELIASGRRCAWGGCGDSNSLVVENVVKKEVVGIGWIELKELEIDILGREIEGKLIEELVENAVVDFTGRT
ncbi:uncharacterized protein LOC133311542 [Gastrolobium bilobum]|uniref:uncharacterized protein LOC133311542 n=1 Tax=Gastrolobium bilobum TaxID=150636 RepID=UPI002AB199BB|nr:uncharacterized protein LOC133311542 [Gastrolobium bilobum]